MKKHYFLLLGATVAVLSTQAQNQLNRIPPPDDALEIPDGKAELDLDLGKNKLFLQKAFGDTLYYQDFNGGLPSGWSIVNNNSNSFIWTWDTVYKQGAFSATRNAIKSSTAANGFMSLPSDFYNTPTPSTGRVSMDTYFESDTITIVPKRSVWVSYQQYLRYCCNASNRLVLQVSTDNFVTFTEYDAKDGLAVNTGNTSDVVGGTSNVINISTAVANQSQFKFRFLSEGNGRYFWMIDDIAIIEGVDNDLQLNFPYMEFHDALYRRNPFYGQIPYVLFPPLYFSSSIYNNGSETQTNVLFSTSVDHTSLPGGAPGLGNVYAVTTPMNPSNMVSGSISDSSVSIFSGTPYFIPFVLGSYRVNYAISSDSTDNNPGDETGTSFFTVTDTVFARDDNGFGAGTGPASYVRNNTPGGTTVGDRFGVMYIIEPQGGAGNPVPTSISYAVSDDPRNIGVEIVPKIWAYNEDSSSINTSFTSEVASSFFPYTVTANDTNRLLTLPLTSGSAVTAGLSAGQYVAGWEVTNLPSGTTFEVYNDGSSAALQEPVTAFNFLGHSPGWSWVAVNPGIRLNFGGLTVGLGSSEKEDAQFAISPNPSNGETVLEFPKNFSGGTYQLSIQNSLGQTVYLEQQQFIANSKFNLDLKQLESGLYFLSLENKQRRLIQRLIIN